MPVGLVLSVALVILLYCILFLWYLISYSRYTGPEHDERGHIPVKVSVIIPVRNEEQHLHSMFKDLLTQDHQLPDYEVIFVDDHSSDRSVTFIEQFCQEHPAFRILQLPGHVTGKKHAVAAGIEAATGDCIIQTDADCRLPECFISGHVRYSAFGADLVIGPVVVQAGKSIWSRLEALEHFSLTATGLAAAAAARPVMCSGANLSYSKDVFRESEAALLSIPHVSGDDVFLLEKAKKSRRNIQLMSEPGMVVMTSPSAGPLKFLQQRTRWGSKARHYRDPDMVTLSLLVGFTNAMLTGLLVATPFVEGMGWMFLSAWGIKSVVDYLLLREVAVRLEQKHLLGIFPVAALFYYFYVTIAGILSLSGSFAWKGRRHH